MRFSIILLGVLIILTIFNVGEKTLKKLKITKKWALIILLLMLALSFVPKIEVNNVWIDFNGFILPILFCLWILIKTKFSGNLFKTIFVTLISFSLFIVYDLITFDAYIGGIFQPYIVLALILGVVGVAIIQDPIRLFVPQSLGLLASEIFFYTSRYSIYGDYYFILGGEKIFSSLLVIFISSVISYQIIRRVKAKILRRRLSVMEREI